MKNLKRKLFKMRLMSAILASIELANVGITSYAIKPSDTQTSTATSESKTEARVKTAEKMEEMSPEKLLDYLKRVSTVEELECYYDNGTLDKSRQDVQNFKLLEDRTKNSFFEYIIKLISERNLKVTTFKKLPMEIRTEFFNYAIAQECDLKDILTGLDVNEQILNYKNIMSFIIDLVHIVEPQVSIKIYTLMNEVKGTIEKAIISEDMDTLRENIAAQPNFNYDADTEFGCKFIECAALFGNVEAFKYFFNNNAKITENTNKFAIIGANLEIIHIIEQNTKNYSSILNDKNTITGLISANREDLFDWLQLHFGKINNAILDCCKTGNFSFLIKIFKDNTPEQKSLNEALGIAVNNQNLEIIKFLIEKGADVNSVYYDGYTMSILAIASKTNNIEIIQLLLDNGAQISSNTLEYAARFSNAHVIKFLMENGADINADIGSGCTILDVTATFGNFDVAKFLIENGVDVNTQDKNGNTALIYSAGNCSDRVAKLLIENSAKVNIANKDGTTALMLAAYRGNYNLVKFLIENGAKVNTADKEGNTALMSAVCSGNTDLVRFLVDVGADINMTDKYGRKALDFASTSDRSTMAKILKTDSCKIA